MKILTALNLWQKQLAVVALVVLTRYVGVTAIATNSDKAPQHIMSRLNLPQTVGTWQSRSVEVDKVVFEVLHPDRAVQKRYILRSAGGPAANVPQVESILIYNRDQGSFHYPVMCLTAGGWVVSSEEKKTISQGAESLTLDVVKAQRGPHTTQLAYFFADTQQQVSGWLPTMAAMAGARLLHRSAGAMHVQFAYDVRSLQPNGEFKPEFAALMLGVAKSVRQSLAQSSARS